MPSLDGSWATDGQLMGSRQAMRPWHGTTWCHAKIPLPADGVASHIPHALLPGKETPMRAVLFATVATFLIIAGSASAQVVQDKKSCVLAVEDAKKATASASITAKVRASADDMVRISEHLCSQANFVYAERLLAIVRGMTAQE